MTMKNVEVMCGDPRAHQKLYVLCDMKPQGGETSKGDIMPLTRINTIPTGGSTSSICSMISEKSFQDAAAGNLLHLGRKAWMCKLNLGTCTRFSMP
jgi:hypothetical protein